MNVKEDGGEYINIFDIVFKVGCILVVVIIISCIIW